MFRVIEGHIVQLFAKLLIDKKKVLKFKYYIVCFLPNIRRT